MLRRHLIALDALVAFGGPAVGELLAELGSPPPAPGGRLQSSVLQ